MNREQIIQMAQEAGIGWLERAEGISEFLEAFAKLVAEHEREACAKVCEENATDLSEGDWDSACLNCADHIRERGQA